MTKSDTFFLETALAWGGGELDTGYSLSSGPHGWRFCIMKLIRANHFFFKTENTDNAIDFSHGRFTMDLLLEERFSFRNLLNDLW